MTDPSDQLYSTLAQLHVHAQQTESEWQSTVAQIESEQAQLQEQRSQAEEAGDHETLAQVDAQLDELDQAYRLCQEHLNE